jgi:hypothetical protein
MQDKTTNKVKAINQTNNSLVESHEFLVEVFTFHPNQKVIYTRRVSLCECLGSRHHDSLQFAGESSSHCFANNSRQENRNQQHNSFCVMMEMKETIMNLQVFKRFLFQKR